MSDGRTAICTNCGRAIFAATARATGGRCRPCANKVTAEIARAKWQQDEAEGLKPFTKKDFERIRNSSDPEAACHLVFDKAHWKWTVHGEAALTVGERTVIAVETFFGETCNGGFLQYLTNESGSLARYLPESLMRVGLTQYVPLALELRDLVPGGISPDADERFDEVDEISTMEEDPLEDLTDRFFELHSHDEPDEFRAKLAAYIKLNEPEFVSSGSAV